MQWEGILSWTITRRQVSRDLWLLRPSPVTAHWVIYQPKPSSELGTSLPSNVGQDGYEMPPKVWLDLWPKWAMSTTNWHLPTALPMTEQQSHLPSASTETEPHAAIAVNFQQPLREFRLGWGTLCSRESGGTGLGKHQIPSWWHHILMTNKNLL